MNQYSNTNCLRRVALRLALILVSFVLNSFFVRAQASATSSETTTVARFWFPYDNYNLSLGYMGNANSLSILDKALRQADPSVVELSIVSYSSLEGNYNYNVWLSSMRANAVKNYLALAYPQFASTIAMNPGSESWSALRANIVNDQSLSEKSRSAILGIIDSDQAPDVKENLLKALPEYTRLYADYFYGLRYADVALVVGTSAEPTVTTTDGTTDDTTTATPADDNAGDATAAGAVSGRSVVYYVVNEGEIRPSYMDNEENLYEIRRILSGPANVRNIVVVGAASPEGSVEFNEKLSQHRAESFVKYLLEVCPEAEGKIEIVSIGENWDGLREAVLVDENLTPSQKDEVLSIIDNEPDLNRREVRLRTSSAWNTVRDNILPRLRYSGIGRIEFEAVDTTSTVPAADTTDVQTPVDTTAVLPPADTTSVLPPADTTQVETPADTSAVVPPVDTSATAVTVPDNTVTEPVKPVDVLKDYKTIFALKTNLLYDVASALNFEVEVPIADRWSVMVEDVFPWWETGNKYCFQHWEIGVEPRFWFKPWDPEGKEKLRGFFVGPYLMSAKYDFQYDRSLNYQGEYWSAGISAGYAMPIGRKKRMNLEFNFALGYLQSDYRHYMPADDYSKLIRDPYEVGTRYYFGPTKAKVSLVLPINVPKKIKEVRYE